VKTKRKSFFAYGRAAFYSVVETLLRNVSGGLGQRLRYLYYSRRFHSCGKDVKIDEGVIFVNPEGIAVGNKVWFLPYSMITGRGHDVIPAERIVVHRGGVGVEAALGAVTVRIGDQTSIGAYNILHGYGGLIIGNRVTTSARVSLYSFSHIPNDPERPNLITYANSMVDDAPVACISSPITVQDGVWLGLNVAVFGGAIGTNAFVEANSIVMHDIPPNAWASGQPASVKKQRFRGD
jgi:acetyltransferase-like isoleucine patch superfamily enzyme